MKNITQQYQDLQEGKMSQANFMVNVRRQFPDWISAGNSFKDAISILKSKRIITEVSAKQTFQADLRKDPDYRASVAAMQAQPSIDQRYGTVNVAQQDDYMGNQFMEPVDDNEGDIFEEAGTGNLYCLVDDSGKIVDQTQAETEEGAKEYFEDAYGPIGSSMMIVNASGTSDMRNLDENDDSNSTMIVDATRETRYIVNINGEKYRINYFGQEEGGQVSLESVTNPNNVMEGTVIATLPSGAIKVEIESDSVEKKTFADLAKDDFYGEEDDTDMMFEVLRPKKTIKEAEDKSEGSYKKVTGKEQYAGFAEIDTVNPYEFKRGVAVEMGMQYKPIPNYFTPDFNPEALAKASKKVFKNLKKDPAYYSNSVNAETQKRSGMTQGTPKEPTYPDAMILVKGHDNAKSNSETNLGKKEKGTKNPEGVKTMTGTKKSMGRIAVMKSNDKIPKGVMVMREGLDEASGTYTLDSEMSPDNQKKVKAQIEDATFDAKDGVYTVSSTMHATKNIEHVVNQVLGTLAPIDRYKDVALGQTMKEKMDAAAIAAAKKTGDVVKIPKEDTAAIAAAEQNKLTHTTY